LFIIPGVWKVGQCHLWAICSLSQEFGKLAIVICGRFVHYPRSLESWPLLSVGDFSLSQGFGELANVICGRIVHYLRSLESWPCNLWASSLSQEFGKLAIVICGRCFIIPGVWKVGQCYLWAIVHYPRSLEGGPLFSVSDLFIIPGSLAS
jgi:hypothetical protein